MNFLNDDLLKNRRKNRVLQERMAPFLRVVASYCWGHTQSVSVPLALRQCVVHWQSVIHPQVYSVIAQLNTVCHGVPLPVQLPVQACGFIPPIQAVVKQVDQSCQKTGVHSQNLTDVFCPSVHSMEALSSTEWTSHGLPFGGVNQVAFHSLSVEAFKPPTYHQLPIQVFSKATVYTSSQVLEFSKTVKAQSKLNSLQSLPLNRLPIPAHRFPPNQRAVFRTKLAEQCTEPGSILIRYVYDRVAQGVYQKLQPQSDGALVCRYKTDVTLDQLAHQYTEMGMVVVGQHMATRETVTAFIPMHDLGVD